MWDNSEGVHIVNAELHAETTIAINDIPLKILSLEKLTSALEPLT